MDLILTNANILTVDAGNRRAEAVAIRKGRIEAVGGAQEITSMATPTTQIMDLGGRTVIPGIIDSHNHLPTAGAAMEGVLAFGCTTIAELQERVAARARRAAPGEWIEGYGWIECQFAENRAPTRRELDEAAPDNPVILYRLFGAVAVNSKALKAAHITRDSGDPSRGEIERDPATREPTGVLRNGAHYSLRGLIPRGSEAENQSRLERQIMLAGQEYRRFGITSVLDPGVSVENMRAYHNVHRQGRLPLRVNMMPSWHGLFPGDGDSPEDLNRRAAEFGVMSGFGDPWLRIGALKMALDGGLGSKTAWMKDPWPDGSRKVLHRLDPERLAEYIGFGHDLGWDIGIHACGDLAVERSAQAFAQAQRLRPRGGARHNIIHAYFATDESLRLMQEYGIALSVQPSFIWIEGDLYGEMASEERLASFKPLRSYVEAGLVVAANSDMTSSHYNPFWGMHAAVARETAQGRVFGTAEAVDRVDMLRMFTINGAYLMGEEQLKGSIEPGKFADMAVLSDDPLRVSTSDLRNLQVLMTLLDGEVAWQAEGFMLSR